mgnify:FL=1
MPDWWQTLPSSLFPEMIPAASRTDIPFLALQLRRRFWLYNHYTICKNTLLPCSTKSGICILRPFPACVLAQLPACEPLLSQFPADKRPAFALLLCPPSRFCAFADITHTEALPNLQPEEPRIFRQIRTGTAAAYLAHTVDIAVWNVMLCQITYAVFLHPISKSFFCLFNIV